MLRAVIALTASATPNATPDVSPTGPMTLAFFLFLAVALGFLFVSMRRQLRKVNFEEKRD